MQYSVKFVRLVKPKMVSGHDVILHDPDKISRAWKSEGFTFASSYLLEVEAVLFDVVNRLVGDALFYVVILWMVGLVA